MDEVLHKRRSRRSRSRKKPGVQLTARDIDIFRLLHRYRYLRSTFIHAIVGGYPTNFKWRLRDLMDDGYIARPDQQWGYANSNYMPAIYELDSLGEETLKAHGYWRHDLRPSRTAPHHHFPHDLMVCDILCSIEIGVRADPKLRLIDVHEILDRAPKHTQELPNPLAFAINGTYVIPDALFGIEGPQGVLLYAVEADRQNEPLVRRSQYGSSYQKKLDNYRALLKTGAYREHLGTKASMLVMHVTTNETHKKNIMQLAGEAKAFLYKTLPSLGDFERAPQPTPALLSEPWARNGYEAFSINR